MRTKHLTATAIAAVAVIVSALVFLHLHPFDVAGARYRVSGETEWQVEDPPISVTAGSKSVEVEAVIFLSNPAYTHAVMDIDGCIESLTINRKELRLKPDLCLSERVLLEPEYLKKGNNWILLTLRNDRKIIGFDIRFLPQSPVRAIPWVSILIALTVTWLVWVRHGAATRAGVVVSGALLFGTLLRIAYLYGTPYDARAHDIAGHVQYIHQMVETFEMPRAAEGWSKHHPPLYYTFTSAWIRLFALPFKFPERLRMVQLQSLIFSVLTLAIALRIGWETLHRKNLRTLALYSFAIAGIPGLVYTSTRINNDALVQVWMFLSLLLLLRWWRTGTDWSWFGTVFAAIFGILTKLTAMIMLPVIGCCLLFKSDKSRTYRIRLGIATLIAVAGTTGWFFYERLAVDQSTYMITGNRVGNWLRVENSLRSVTVFSPLRIVRQPYNMSFGEESRNYFWEFYFRSMFFGQFRHRDQAYDPLAVTILIVAMALIPVFLFGLWRDAREDWRKHLPLLLCLLWIFAAQIARRHVSPFAPGQDFRLTILTAVPIVFYLTAGIARLPVRARTALEYSTYLLIGLCTIFIVTLSLAS